MKFPFLKNRLKRAIGRGLSEGNLEEELDDLGEVEVKSSSDAEAVCWGLDQLKEQDGEQVAEQTSCLARLFQDVPGTECDAFDIMQTEGTARLIYLFDKIHAAGREDDSDCLMFILKVLSMYGTTEGTLKVIEAAHEPLEPGGYMWSVILSSYEADHPQNSLLYPSLSDDLPPGFIAVSLLDAGNAAMLGEAEMTHPFDTDEGRKRLRAWLSNTNSEEYSYAHSATVALPFVSEPDRTDLLQLAMSHADNSIKIEAAWASAKIGNQDGLDRLIDFTADYRTAQVASHYLEELGRNDLIPDAAKEPEFAALSEFAQWLAHPNELGQPPDELDVIDHRELAWPPERETKPFWLVKYRLRKTGEEEEEDVECGLVGSVTWCFFTYGLVNRPPEHAYAIHCYWEMQHHGLIDETDVEEEADHYENLLQEWTGTKPENAQVRYVTELSPELGYPQRIVGLATGRMNGSDGWLILDGERSCWHAKADPSEDTSDSLPLMIHVGVRLLGLED